MRKFKNFSDIDVQNHMNNVSLKTYYALSVLVAAASGFIFVSENNNVVSAQNNSELNVGDNTGMASDTFFQLDDSILTMKSLVNETQTSLENNNTADAKNYLTQIYNELVQISNNSNSLIWDVSNEGN